MQKVRIYPNSKSQTQSGMADVGLWVIEPELLTPRRPEQLMGWMAADDTLSQLRMEFPTRDLAEQFAKSNGWRYTITGQNTRQVKPRNYAQNHVYDPTVEQ